MGCARCLTPLGERHLGWTFFPSGKVYCPDCSDELTGASKRNHDNQRGKESSARNEAKPNVPNQKAVAPTPAWLPVESASLIERLEEMRSTVLFEGLFGCREDLLLAEVIQALSQPLPPPPSLIGEG